MINVLASLSRSDETALSFVHVLSVDRLVCELASEVHFS